MVGPGDDRAASAGDQSPVRASRAGREQVIGALKAAFVRGMLTKDEFELRVGQVLATYADLDALTADIPAGLTPVRAPVPARQSPNKNLIARGTAAGAGASVVLAAGGGAAVGQPVAGLILAGVFGLFAAVLIAGLLTLLAWVLDKSASRQRSRGAPPGASPKARRRPASAGWAGPPSQISHDPPRTAKAAPSRRLKPWSLACGPS